MDEVKAGEPTPQTGLGTPDTLDGLPVIPGYQILDELGAGGMGVVYRAKHLALDRIVAIKMLRGFNSKEDLARFLREAETSAGLHHTQIAQVYEVGALSGVPYFSMEFLEGGSLCSRCGKLDARESAMLMQSLARAVHYAHTRGVVHRDLKPANVLFSEDGFAKISDFGIAKRMEEDAHLTQTGAVIGTPQYMAPEQARGDSRSVGPAADVYALGAILYEVLTGRPPFVSTESTIPITLRVMQEEAVSPTTHLASIPRDLDVICMKCLEKDPQNRYASADALAEDLRRYLANEPILAKPPTTIIRTVKWVKRNPVRSITLLVIGFILGWGSYAYWQWDSYQRVYVKYYNNVNIRYGRWIGLGPLTEEDIRHRTVSVKMYQHGRKGSVYRFEYINSRGNIAEDNNGKFSTWIDGFGSTGTEKSPATVIADFDLDEHGLARQATCRDMRGHVTFVAQFVYSMNPDGRPREVTVRFLNQQNWELSSVHGASYVEVYQNDQGYQGRGMFFDNHHKPAMNNGGTYGQAATCDDNGVPIKSVFLDERAQPMAGDNGLVQLVVRSSNPYGDSEEIEFRDKDDKPMTLATGEASRKISYDRWGNILSIERLPGAGSSIRLQGWSREVHTIDPNTGQLKEIAYFDADGKPTQGGADDQFKTAFQYDSSGYVSERVTYDAKMTETSNEKMKRDEHGNVVEKVFYKNGKQAGRVIQEFDEQGNVTLAEYHDSSDHVFERELYKYKNGDRLIEDRTLAADGKPLHQLEGTPLQRTGYDLQTYEWDANGLETAQVQHGFLNRPYTAERQEFDGRGRTVKLICQDDAGNRVNNEEGWAEVESVYGTQSQWSGRRFFTADHRSLPEVVFIGRLLPGGVAEKAGLKPGDVLRSYDGKPINSTFDYASMREQDAGETTERDLIVSRDGRDLPAIKLKAGQLLGVAMADRFSTAASRPTAQPAAK